MRRCAAGGWADKINKNRALAEVSLKLVQLCDEVPTPTEPEAFDKRRPDPNILLPWLEQQDFRSLLQRFKSELGEANVGLGLQKVSGLPFPIP